MMPPEFSAIPGAQGYQQSNPSVFATVALLGALETFELSGGIHKLRQKSVRLTGYLEKRLRKLEYFVEKYDKDGPSSRTRFFTIITPKKPDERGAQLSLLFYPPQSGTIQKIEKALKARGVIADERQPDVIRFAPNPLYNTFQDCLVAANALDEAFKELDSP